ncbi:MAG: DUF4411 family protein [Campylobacterales bacterium]
MSYLLDANVFIQAKNLQYGLDFCPAFWDWIVEQNAAAKVFSIDKVADELANGADELTEWAQRQPNGLFKKTDPQTAMQFGRVNSWVMAQNYEPAAINTFLQVADFYLIAHALATQSVIVTHETAANSTKRIKIPNVCIGLDLRFMTPYEMLRREQARFVLGRT